ncbi:glucosaminidase domain-containing protein [Flavobacterium amniphilum]|uniref:glucosaminidase domain-containing protein n=1 Tax=Flavobacterium amniphilum TaxID=1834035 RepID=UPI002029D4F5|nr:glucosaminidase domain-containing protein [Flavobacterium amniphilum]MCL9807353.1 glucosaminidase domain-containing protein [Flavobacterium amniphilum]
MNKILYLIIGIILVGCGSAKPKVQTVKKKSVPSKTVQVNQSKKTVKPEDKIVIDDAPKKSEELVATSRVKVTSEVVFAYIDQFKEIAKDNMQKHGIPASITLAQGILESGAGTGMLCNLANNHFGIKCHKEWTGEYVRYDDDAAQECFRKYEHPKESYRDHSLFLTSRPWYAPLFKLPKDDYKAWSYGLKKSGYATDPKYPNKLIGLIERYQLQRYDAEVLGKEYKSEIKTEIKSEEKINENNVTVSAENTHTVAQGETLYSISKKYNVTVDTLKTKNNLTDNAISIGQILIIR